MVVDFAHDPSQATSGLWAEIEKRLVMKTMKRINPSQHFAALMVKGLA
jgi:hypothetical protein